MKNIYFLLLLLPFSVTAQFQNTDEGNLYYEEVVQADSLSKQEIHTKVNEWFSEKFNSTNSEIRTKNTDKIVFNLVTPIDYKVNGMPYPANIDFTLTTEFKEGKYRLKFDNIYSNINGFRRIVNNKQMTFEEYKAFYKTQIDEMEGYTKKASLKMLNNEKQMREVYKVAMRSSEDIFINTQDKIEKIVGEIKEQVKSSNQNNDW